MNILVTGSDGFIGKNLLMKLRENKKFTIYECDKETDRLKLEKYCKEAEFVYHLAGINRTDNEEDFMKVNYGFTLDLLDLLSKYNNRCPLMFSSSIQADYSNTYGKSKKAAEDIIIDYSDKNRTNVYIYRLPNVFGKWCKPNYNSVVATFCHNITRNLPIKVDEPEKVLKLIYIDDLINELIRLPNSTDSYSDNNFYDIKPTYQVSLRKLSDLLYLFKKCGSNGYIPDLGDEFTKKLYSTYLSYLPEDSLSYKLRMHCDDRGSFTEFLKSHDNGQISINVIKPGITKGNHYHHTKAEKFLIVSGRGVIRLKDVISGNVLEYFLSSDNMEVIEIPSGYAHNIENLGDRDLVVIIWCNEVFNKDNLDTYIEEI